MENKTNNNNKKLDLTFSKTVNSTSLRFFYISYLFSSFSALLVCDRLLLTLAAAAHLLHIHTNIMNFTRAIIIFSHSRREIVPCVCAMSTQTGPVLNSNDPIR